MNCPKGCEFKESRKEIEKHLDNCTHKSGILQITPSGEIMSSQEKYWWTEQTFKLPIEFSF